MDIPVQDSAAKSYFGRSRLLLLILFTGLLALGIAVRFINLTNPPLDFIAWRQLRSASIARGMYYQMIPSADPQTRQLAIGLGSGFEKLEPEIFERMVALTYFLTGGERLWLARLYAILFWLVGGLALFGIARKTASIDGSLTALAFYLVLPFGVYASRSFLPDVPMVMMTLLAVYALANWVEKRTWKWVVFAGVTAGLAVLLKVFAVYTVAAVAVLLVTSRLGIRKAIVDRQVWVTAGVMVVIPSLYYILDIKGGSTAYLSNWVFAFSRMVFTPGFYSQWLKTVDQLVPLPFVFAGLTGLFLVDKQKRMVLLGMWLGYLMIGLSVPALIISHTYYNLLLVPLTALSLSPLAGLFFSHLTRQSRLLQLSFIGVALLAMAYPCWAAQSVLKAKNYRNEIIGWQIMGQVLPRDGGYIGMTNDYNTRLIYYGWLSVTQWPHVSDMQMLAQAGQNYDTSYLDLNQFNNMTKGYRYFIVTETGELDAQPALKKYLYDNYPLVKVNKFDFPVFDLGNKKIGSCAQIEPGSRKLYPAFSPVNTICMKKCPFMKAVANSS